MLGALETACSSRPVEDETGSDTATPNLSTSEGDTSSTSTTTTTSTTSTTSSTTSTSEPTTLGTSSTGELSTTADIDTSDTGCSFYGGCPADFANPLECDPFLQDCPEGQKCSPQKSDGLAFDATACVPVAREPDQPGEPCTVEGAPGSGLDSCVVGSTCWEVDEQTLAGTCVPLCGGTPDSPSARRTPPASTSATPSICACRPATPWRPPARPATCASPTPRPPTASSPASSTCRRTAAPSSSRASSSTPATSGSRAPTPRPPPSATPWPSAAAWPTATSPRRRAPAPAPNACRGSNRARPFRPRGRRRVRAAAVTHGHVPGVM
ncbi:hypothetical protein [Nannocystis pusilla]|uniref:hypothetical protein n=1 Tax=Nannocystis pusilla TaxID=889268 RepID=UPI003B7CF494